LATIRRGPERRAAGHPGDGRPEFCGDKKMRPILWRHKIRAEGSVSHTERRVPQPVWGVSPAKRPALGVGQPPAPPLPPSPHVPSGAFPRGLPPRLPGLSRGISPSPCRVFPGDPPPEGGRGKPMGFARTKPQRSPGSAPRRSNRPARPGRIPGMAGASQGLLPGPFPGSAWEGHGGMGVVAEETGGEQRWAALERRKPSRTV
jgi:hypothetical protein